MATQNERGGWDISDADAAEVIAKSFAADGIDDSNLEEAILAAARGDLGGPTYASRRIQGFTPPATVDALIELLYAYRGRKLKVDFGRDDLGKVIDLIIYDDLLVLDVVSS